MRVRGTGQMLRTLSRVALIGMIGGAAAAWFLGRIAAGPTHSRIRSTRSPRHPVPDGSLKSVPPVAEGSESNGFENGLPSRDASEEQAAAAPPIMPMSATRDSVRNI